MSSKKVELNEDIDLKEELVNKESKGAQNASEELLNNAKAANIQSNLNQSVKENKDVIDAQQANNETKNLIESLKGFGAEILNKFKIWSENSEFNPGELWKDFKELSYWEKLGVFVLTGAAVAIVGVASWALIYYLWPQIKKFLTTKEGAEFVGNAAASLISLTQVMKQFKFEEEMKEVADDEDKEMTMDKDKIMSSVLLIGSPFLSQIITKFYTFLQKQFQSK